MSKTHDRYKWQPQFDDWEWDGDDVVIINREWFDDNYIEIKKWFTEQAYLTHLTFQGSSRIHVKFMTPALKTMFTLRWK